jgi:phosphoenolpyruvate carboxykinase (GTP)
MVPLYADIKRLFKETLGKDYSPEDYVNQFSIRVPENLAKIRRVAEFHRTQSENTPEALFEVLKRQQARLEQARAKFGDRIRPECFGGQ